MENSETLDAVALRVYKNEINVYSVQQSISQGCNAITFINNGTQNVNINNAFLLLPGQTFGVGGNKDELDMTRYNFFFTGAGNPSLIVIRKVYQ